MGARGARVNSLSTRGHGADADSRRTPRAHAPTFPHPHRRPVLFRIGRQRAPDRRHRAAEGDGPARLVGAAAEAVLHAGLCGTGAGGRADRRRVAQGGADDLHERVEGGRRRRHGGGAGSAARVRDRRHRGRLLRAGEIRLDHGDRAADAAGGGERVDRGVGGLLRAVGHDGGRAAGQSLVDGRDRGTGRRPAADRVVVRAAGRLCAGRGAAAPRAGERHRLSEAAAPDGRGPARFPDLESGPVARPAGRAAVALHDDAVLGRRRDAATGGAAMGAGRAGFEAQSRRLSAGDGGDRRCRGGRSCRPVDCAASLAAGDAARADAGCAHAGNAMGHLARLGLAGNGDGRRGRRRDGGTDECVAATPRRADPERGTVDRGAGFQ